MGRTPQPTALKILRGNPGKRTLPKNEPTPPHGPLRPPPEITGPLAQIWDELAGPLTDLGLLTVADVPTFAKLVHIEHTLRMLFPHILADESAMRDYVKLATLVVRYYDKFGMNPSARTNIVVNKPTTNPLNDFLAAGG